MQKLTYLRFSYRFTCAMAAINTVFALAFPMPQAVLHLVIALICIIGAYIKYNALEDLENGDK